jgi:UDP-glucose:(heptosyl)LPS alpha-1,3-glucosyltransferase
MIAPEVGPPGGTEAQAGRLAQAMADSGWDVTVIARRCAVPGVRWIRIRGPRRPALVAFPWFFAAASLAAIRHRGGITHSTGSVAAVRTDVSTVHFCHAAYLSGGHPSRARRRNPAHRLNAWAAERLGALAERLCYRPGRALALVAVSHGVAREIESHFPAMAPHVRVIPNGVDRDAFRPDPEARARVRADLVTADEDLLALFVGGDWARKGLAVAVEAVAKAPGWRLVVAGDGDGRGLAALAARRGVADRVLHVGPVERPGPYYAAADAFVLPTAYETFSLVSYEAAAAGLPLICTRVSGIEDILRDGETGFEVPRDAGAIAEKLTALREDPDLRMRLGAAARASTEGYDWADAATAYGRLLAELAASGQTAARR